MDCPKCNGGNTKKNGTSRGRQRWHCKDCVATFTENPTPRGGNKPLDEEITACAQQYGISRDAARKRIRRAAKKKI